MTLKSKALLIPVVIACSVAFVFLGMRVARAARRSPHGFNPPQCTWWVDLRCTEISWTLKFKQNYGRDAHLWPALLSNAEQIPSPRPGCIAVFKAWPGGPVGHVAFVETVNDEGFTISHANYKIGEEFLTISNTPIRRAAMQITANEPDVAQFEGSELKYQLIYLAKK